MLEYSAYQQQVIRVHERQESYGNLVLYRMCAESFLHESVDHVSSKLWLIGNAYSARLDRRKTSKEQKAKDTAEGGIHYVTARLLINSNLDDMLANLKTNTIDRDTLPKMLETHHYLITLIHETTGQNKRSLASKYLHFHLPDLFFIYDSIASYRITKHYVPRMKIPELNVPYDYHYAEFSNHSLLLQHQIQEQSGIILNPRQLDCLLLRYD